MEKDMINIGVICPSEIAFRRFMPALGKNKDFIFNGIATAGPAEYFTDENTNISIKQEVLFNEKTKAESFIDSYGGMLYPSYEAIITSPDIDALYIPLPPALHYQYAKSALENGKHVLLEKPATLELNQTKDLVNLAESRSLALHENYMFVFHDQIKQINTMINDGVIGDIRLFRISFGFPKRAANDFRYNKELGGGAFYDAGGYVIKYAAMLLGNTGDNVKIKYSDMNYTNEFSVDIYGSAVLTNDNGTTAQVAYGMDNGYRCDLEAWGSTGILTTNRILTAPDGFVPEVIIKNNAGEEKVLLKADDTFAKSIAWFKECIYDSETRKKSYKTIIDQAMLVNEFLRTAR